MQEPEVKFASKPSVPFEQLKIKSSFSLNEVKNYNIGQPNSAGPSESPQQTLPDKEVDFDLVKTAVLKYAETKEKEGSRQIPTILKTAEIRFENSTVTLVINNETQKEQFLLIKQAFVDELRFNLQNSKIALEIEISKSETQVKAYKPVDIFKAMSEKNPALLELKKRFDLEIDY